jgi:hypothetical protein
MPSDVGRRRRRTRVGAARVGAARVGAAAFPGGEAAVSWFKKLISGSSSAPSKPLPFIDDESVQQLAETTNDLCRSRSTNPTTPTSRTRRGTPSSASGSTRWISSGVNTRWHPSRMIWPSSFGLFLTDPTRSSGSCRPPRATRSCCSMIRTYPERSWPTRWATPPRSCSRCGCPARRELRVRHAATCA